MKKFDFAIGNPAYQKEGIGNNTRAPSVYNDFMDAAFRISDKVLLITPARFLFNAGDTSKKWNKKMLADPHFKVLKYEQDSKIIFAGKDIKGGIAITYRDATKNFGAIGVFTHYEELNSILHKVLRKKDFIGLDSITFSPVAFKFTQLMHDEHPNLKSKLSKGNEFEVKTNVFDTINEVFYDTPPKDGNSYIGIYGRKQSKRFLKYIKKEYIFNNTNLGNYKVLLPEANGKGELGETLSTPFVAPPMTGYTQTFVSFGKFQTSQEANNCLKYIKCKFTRAMLGTLKITQHNSISAWKNVPLQDFTNHSDLDWSKSIREIDQQLYKKYNLSDEEIEFIETHVKEMD